MYGTAGVWPCHRSQFRWPGTGRSTNGPPDGFGPVMQVTLRSLPSRPGSHQLDGQAKLPVAPLPRADLDDAARLLARPSRSSLPSSIVSVSGFSMYTSLPARQASISIFVCQWSGVAISTTSTSLRSSSLR